MTLRLARDILAEGTPIRAVSNIEQAEGPFLLIMIVVWPMRHRMPLWCRALPSNDICGGLATKGGAIMKHGMIALMVLS
ncbi:MAG: hypothetical protein ABIR36_16190, partial [Nitrospiraceae bacterium]